MGIEFTSIRTALLAWWAGIGVTVGSTFVPLPVSIMNEPTNYLDPRVNAEAIINVIAVRRIGHDEIRKVDAVVSGRPVLTPEVCGSRVITVSVRCEANDQKASRTAMYWAERGRTRLRMPTVEESLRAGGLALVETGPLIDVSSRADERIRSRAVFDVQFACVSIETALAADAVDTVGSIEFASDDLTNQAGLAVDPQIVINLADRPVLQNSDGIFIETHAGDLIEVTE